MTAIAAEIIAYWIGMGVCMWILMYGALVFAKVCEFLADRIIR
jgi:hypothetical protein